MSPGSVDAAAAMAAAAASQAAAAGAAICCLLCDLSALSTHLSPGSTFWFKQHGKNGGRVPGY